MISKPKILIITTVTIIIIAGASYFVYQNSNSTNNNENEDSAITNQDSLVNQSGNDIISCANFINIEDTLVEKDSAGDPEAWLRFDYTSTADQDLDCQYSINFYSSEDEIIRTITDTEDTFLSSGGQFYNGYSSTPYQPGMTATVTIN